MLGFQAHSDESFILGAVFLRNYFTVFDMEYGIVGLSPHTSSSATLNMFDRKVPDASIDNIAPADDLTIDSLGFFANVSLVLFLLICCCCIYS